MIVFGLLFILHKDSVLSTAHTLISWRRFCEHLKEEEWKLSLALAKVIRLSKNTPGLHGMKWNKTCRVLEVNVMNNSTPNNSTKIGLNLIYGILPCIMYLSLLRT